MHFCYCGECSGDVPRAKDYNFYCYDCAVVYTKIKNGFEDLAPDVTRHKCSSCGVDTFCISVRKEVVDES